MAAPEVDVAEVRRELLARREDLRTRLAGLSRPPERGDIGFGKRVGDGTIEAVSRLNDIGVGANLEATEERVTRALAKIEEGTYGVCDSCGGPIAPARLKAAPESALCIACARLARR